MIFAVQRDVCNESRQWEKVAWFRKPKRQLNRIKKQAQKNPNRYICFGWHPDDGCWAHCEYVRECDEVNEQNLNMPDGSVVIVHEKDDTKAQ